MRLSNLQAMMLFQSLRDTLVIADSANVFTFDREQRMKLAKDILNQQNKDLIELDTSHIVPITDKDAGVPQEERK